MSAANFFLLHRYCTSISQTLLWSVPGILARPCAFGSRDLIVGKTPRGSLSFTLGCGGGSINSVKRSNNCYKLHLGAKTGRRTRGGAGRRRRGMPRRNARARWRSADAEVGAGSRGGASGKRETHTRSISVENGQDGRRSRGRRRRSTRQGRDGRHAGRGNTAHDTTGSGSLGRETGGRRSGIGSRV